MVWQIEFDRQATKQLERLTPSEQTRIWNFLHDRIASLPNARQHGKALQGSTLGNLWRYRVGDYRIICDLKDDRLIVLVLAVGHRKDVYR